MEGDGDKVEQDRVVEVLEECVPADLCVFALRADLGEQDTVRAPAEDLCDWVGGGPPIRAFRPPVVVHTYQSRLPGAPGLPQSCLNPEAPRAGRLSDTPSGLRVAGLGSGRGRAGPGSAGRRGSEGAGRGRTVPRGAGPDPRGETWPGGHPWPLSALGPGEPGNGRATVTAASGDSPSRRPRLPAGGRAPRASEAEGGFGRAGGEGA